MLAGSLTSASSFIRPWQVGQASTSTAKIGRGPLHDGDRAALRAQDEVVLGFAGAGERSRERPGQDHGGPACFGDHAAHSTTATPRAVGSREVSGLTAGARPN